MYTQVLIYIVCIYSWIFIEIVKIETYIAKVDPSQYNKGSLKNPQKMDDYNTKEKRKGNKTLKQIKTNIPILVRIIILFICIS